MLTTYSWRTFHCELCKSRFKQKIINPIDRSKHVNLIDLFRPKQNFIILESYIADYGGTLLKKQDSVSWQRDIHVLNFDDSRFDSVRIGRGSMNELRVSDISVSRLHAFIQRDPLNGTFYLRDNESRFGTIVKIQRPLKLQADFEYLIQRGRSIFEIKFRNDSGLWSEWGASNQEAEDDYSEIFLETIGKSCGKEVHTKVLKQVSFTEIQKYL